MTFRANTGEHCFTQFCRSCTGRWSVWFARGADRTCPFCASGEVDVRRLFEPVEKAA